MKWKKGIKRFFKWIWGNGGEDWVKDEFREIRRKNTPKTADQRMREAQREGGGE